ncbi:MAG: DmsC/YnfH family molybdoenzyme membrane anchor subunit [Gammaproteobacteria bacterium]|nr:DmsC/YnfH family molybdoenzyme membrane anchor subunit [Gammaproteobacteria bacterium]
MHPAFSVIFLTTLIGAGQGLFLALMTAETFSHLGALPLQDNAFYSTGSLLVLGFLVAGLAASFFHLGHPERAWRSAAMWRTSWLSREVIALPAFMGIVFVYALLHYLDWNPTVFGTTALPETGLTLLVGIIGVVLCFALFICTAMIYACLKFLQEWHTPLTAINYTLFGMSSGFTLATAYAAQYSSEVTGLFGTWAIILTLAALVTRSASLLRNRRIKHRSSLRTAIGVRHSKIQQKSQGAMGGSFNTREFFHGKSLAFVRSIKWIFLLLVFPLPLLLLGMGLNNDNPTLLLMAFAVQYVGLLAERWFFFAQANHPQNLYYQTI